MVPCASYAEKYEVVAGALQDIVYLICTGTIQYLRPSLRGGGVKYVMIGVCSVQARYPALPSTAQNTMEALQGH